MTILLVRHGETEWNRERRHQGRFDSPLTERGAAQACAAGALLRRLPEAAGAPVVSSPQGRARRTAEIICEVHGNTRGLRVDDRLREHSVGSWDGRTYDEIAAAVPGIFDGDGAHLWYFHLPDSESYTSFKTRLAGWLAEQPEAATVVCVAHGLVSRVLRGLYAGLSRADALLLPIPQDRIFRLSGGSVETIPNSN